MHNVGALASEGETIYCGTGHAYAAGDSFPGVGLFRSRDYGDTWQHLEETKKDFPQRISTIAVHGEDIWIGGVVLPDEQEEASGEIENSGIFYSNNSGNNWKRKTFKLKTEFASRAGISPTQAKGIFEKQDYQCHSIVVLKKANPPKEANAVILAAITGSLNWGGIWRSTDGGTEWEHLTRGLPPSREFGRTSLAVANKAIVYALVGATDGRCLGVFRSCDGGDHWVSHGVEHFAGCGNLNYVNCIAVSPEDPDIVVCGALDLHRSIDGGQTWTKITEWSAAPDSKGYSHADHHALFWPDIKHLYSANDGGVDVSDDNGITWTNLSSGLAIAMFYDIDVAASTGTGHGELVIAGGTQDNASIMTDFRVAGIGHVPTRSGLQFGLDQPMAGSLIELAGIKSRAVQGQANQPKGKALVNFDESGISDLSKQTEVFVEGRPNANGDPRPDFIDILYGDGGWTVFDPGDDPRHVYASSQNMAIYRHRKDNGWQEVTPEDASDEERGRVWMAIIAIDSKDPNTVFTGSTRVWRTNNDGDSWTAVSPDLDGSAITAIEIADADPNIIYVGTENGNIFRSNDRGNRWNDDPGEDLPKPMEWRKALHERPTIGVARTITRIEAHPVNADKFVATLMGFAGKEQRLPHVLYYDDKLNKNDKKWIDLSRTLPNVHYNVVTWERPEKGFTPQTPEHIFVGNDIGVWALATPGGEIEKGVDHYHWVDISADLPNAIVTDLVYHSKSESLTAATYGRSLWGLSKEARLALLPTGKA